MSARQQRRPLSPPTWQRRVWYWTGAQNDACRNQVLNGPSSKKVDLKNKRSSIVCVQSASSPAHCPYKHTLVPEIHLPMSVSSVSFTGATDDSVEKGKGRQDVSARSLSFRPSLRGPRAPALSHGTATYEIEAACFDVEVGFLWCALPYPLEYLTSPSMTCIIKTLLLSPTGRHSTGRVPP